jgi:hypothetical protein
VAHNVPCKRCHGSTASSHTDSSHGDGGLRGMSGPGAPHGRGAAVLRLNGQHSGMITWRRISMSPEHPGRDQGGGEIKAAAAVLTLGRWCSRGRLSVVVHVDVVDVPGSGVPSAPAPLDMPRSRLHGTVAPVLAALASVHVRPLVSPMRRGDSALSSFSSSFPSFFPSSLLSAVEQRKGEKPQVLGREPTGARVWGVGVWSRWREGKDVAALGDWTRRRRGDVATRVWPAEPLLAWLRRAKGSFPLGGFPRRARA